MIDYFNSSAESRMWAEAEGLDVVVPDDRTLTLDIDKPKDEFYDLLEPGYVDFIAQFKRLAKFSPVSIRTTTSKSGGTHVYIGMERPMSVPERIAFQVLLGSDIRRERCAMIRWLSEDPEPLILFEKRGEA